MKRKCGTCTYYMFNWCAIMNENKFSWSSCSEHRLPEEVQEELSSERAIAYIEHRGW